MATFRSGGLVLAALALTVWHCHFDLHLNGHTAPRANARIPDWSIAGNAHVRGTWTIQRANPMPLQDRSESL